MIKAVVIGATGATGRALVHHLLDDAGVENVLVLVRRKSFTAHEKLTETVIDFDHMDQHASQIAGDIAYSCLGTTLKAAGSKEAQWKVDVDYQYRFAQLANDNRIPAFVLLSSMGADATSRIFYSRMKGALEQKVESLRFPHLLIFRPGILLRPQSDRAGEKIAAGAIRFFNRLGMLKRYKPTPVSDLALLMIRKSKSASKELEIVESRDILKTIDSH